MGKAVDPSASTTRPGAAGPAATDAGSADLPPSYDAPPYNADESIRAGLPPCIGARPPHLARPPLPAAAPLPQEASPVIAPPKEWNRRVPPPGAQRALAPL